MSYEKIVVRDCRESELEGLLTLIHQTIDVSYGPVYPPRAIAFFKNFHSAESILERYQAGRILVVEKNATLVATGTLVENEIFGVFVNPKVQCRGYGKALMQKLERIAVDRGITKSELSVSLTSKRFYKSLGYTILREDSIDVGEGEKLDFWRASRPLL